MIILSRFVKPNKTLIIILSNQRERCVAKPLTLHTPLTSVENIDIEIVQISIFFLTKDVGTKI